ncbi:MAG: thiamine pyrophosphate-dependent enzyme [Chloroflexi bacterium]|nr:thiamine pyrophosphate-dependent enzyme [Chloroflexota bacterium]MCL5026153.1 thiamine pyrophosphate-dependent enzyme [Chloroflexota bacterium]
MAKLKPLTELRKEHFHFSRFPTTYCPGCGIGNVLQAVTRAIDETGRPPESFTFAVGIGCYGNIGNYLDFDELRLSHGRVPAMATGLKLARPDLNVIAMMGDGDATAIGGNHLIHAARRNIDITAIILNNHTYGMTGGQYSPATRLGDYATTAPYGMLEPAFDICKLAEGAGATFVARTTTFRMVQTIDIVRRAIEHPGFALVEIDSQCPVIYGRMNRWGDAVSMLKKQNALTVTLEKAKTMTPEELKGKIVVGIFKQAVEPEFTGEYYKVINRVRRPQDAS